MSADPAFIGEDASSASGDDENLMVDGHNSKRQSATPSSGRKKRSRKATADAIVDAMLEIAAASKMRAAAIMKNEERFSISRCIKMHQQRMEDFDLELDEMELVAATAGFYYYNSLSKQPPRPSISPSGSGFMSEVLNGPDDVFREMLRMDKLVFHKLSDYLRHRGLVRDTPGVMIEEQLAIFLNIVGHNERNRVIQERFQHSGETISRHFNNVLKAVKSLSREFLQSPPLSTPPEVLESHRFYPYFKDCIGFMDGMHVLAHVPAKDHTRFRNRKGELSQNVLAACTFDLQFIFVYPGWEGSAADSRVLRAVLDDPEQNFPPIPEGKYFLVDSGYWNMEGFIAPFEGVRYHIKEFRGAKQLPRTPEELFNHRHSCLKKVIRMSFDVLKSRFPILKVAPQYAFQIQRDIVIAACVIHNFVRREERSDWLFAAAAAGMAEEEESSDLDHLPDDLEQLGPQPVLELKASLLRESLAVSMWDDFTNRWDEW